MSPRIVNGPFRLLGSGSALPGPPITTNELCSRLARLGVRSVRRVAALARRLRIESRHLCRNIAAPLETPRAGDSNACLAERATRAALQASQRPVEALGYLLGHTATPHTLLPPNIAWVAERLQYAGPTVELRQACTGFANALQLAAGLLAGPACPAVAIVGSEVGSVYCDLLSLDDQPEQLVNVAQMGDGAAAVVLGPANGEGATIERLFYGSTGPDAVPGLWMSQGGSAEPFPTESDSALHFRHDFARVRDEGPRLLAAGMQAAQAAGIDVERVSRIVPHQANGRMARLLADLLGIEPERFFVNANRVGNTGSAAIWIALHALRTSGGLRAGDTVLVLGAEATKGWFGGFLYRHS